MKTIKLIRPKPPYEKIKNMTIIECGDPLVDLLAISPKIVSGMMPDRMEWQKIKHPLLLARKKVAIKLLKAIDLLQKTHGSNLGLMIFDAHRPIAVQKIWFESEVNKCQVINLKWSRKKCILATKNWLAKPFVSNSLIPPPHSTGGALDLTIIGFNHQRIKRWDMGSDYGKFTPLSWTWTQNITKKARRNRKRLFDLMINCGLRNFDGKWWHFSFGDQDWAVRSHAKQAFFGKIEVDINNRQCIFTNLIRKKILTKL